MQHPRPLLALRTMRNLDASDVQLILALSAEPRSTTVALAEKLGLSRNTVQAHMARLDAAGVFASFERRLDTAALGYPLTAFIEVHVKQKLLASIVRELAVVPEIVQAFGLSGRSDLLVRVVCLDAEDLFRIDALIVACRGVKRTQTSLSMGELIPFRLEPLLRRELASPSRAPRR